jgi:long-subunit fatty acid transport protein
MSNERWDIELDATYELNSRVDEFTAHIPRQPDGTAYDLQVANAGSPLPLPDNTHLEHQWQDQLRLNLGGDFNVIPGLAALRAGVSFETSGLKRGYTQLDFIPGQRIGLHGGLTVRLGRLDISLAYAHIFQRTETVSEGDAAIVQTVALDQAAIDNGDEGARQHTNVNAGRYTVSYDIASLALNYHFQ